MFDMSLFKDGEMAIFAGAGISYDSGLPLANEFKKVILMTLTQNKDDIELIMNSKKMPFELFIQNLPTDVYEKPFKIFTFGEPNANHILIAKLAKIDKVKTILTTNFDLLFERAMENENVDYVVYYCDEDFSKIDFKNMPDCLRIFKIHGSIENSDSLINTIHKVGRPLSQKKEVSLNYFFLNGSHNKIMVIGYSCSDIFDINPYLNLLKKEKCKKTIFLEHFTENSFYVTDLNNINEQHPFSKFNGLKISCITNSFIQNMWQIFEGDIGGYFNPTSKIKWQTHIKKWAKELKFGQKEAILGQLFYSISNYNKATEYYEKSIEIAKKHKLYFPIYKCNLELCNIYQKNGHLLDALSYCEKALEATKYFSSELEREYCKSTLGRIYISLEKHDVAIKYLIESLDYYESKGDELHVAKIYMNLGVCYIDMEKWRKAADYLRMSHDIKAKLGDVQGVSNCYFNLGICFSKMKNYPTAIECFKSAATGFDKLGLLDELSQTYEKISIHYEYLNDHKNKQLYEEKSKNTADGIFYVESNDASQI
jgi:tetratricopeptide (TPR) repeat protein